jgi:hypothetical protein
MSAPLGALAKVDAIVAYTQTLAYVEKARHRADEDAARAECEKGLTNVKQVANVLEDPDLDEIAALLSTYCRNNAR